MLSIDRYYQSLRWQKFSKPIKLLNEKHLQWIRQKRCIVTDKLGVDAHHLQKKSQIQNDYLTIPLDHEVHMLYHSMPEEEFESEFSVDCRDALIAMLVERIVELENGES